MCDLCACGFYVTNGDCVQEEERRKMDRSLLTSNLIKFLYISPA